MRHIRFVIFALAIVFSFGAGGLMVMAEEIADPPRCWPLGEDLSERKTGRYLITDEQLAQVKENVEQFDWAAAAVRAAAGSGDRWVNETDESLA